MVDVAREWSGGEGAAVVMDATGVPDAIRAGVETVASAGRVVIVGMSHHDVPLRVFGFIQKELDVLGVSCAQDDDFERRRELRRGAQRQAREPDHATSSRSSGPPRRSSGPWTIRARR